MYLFKHSERSREHGKHCLCGIWDRTSSGNEFAVFWP